MKWGLGRRMILLVAGLWWTGACGCKTFFAWTLPSHGRDDPSRVRGDSPAHQPPVARPVVTDFASYPSRPGDVVRRSQESPWSNGGSKVQEANVSREPHGEESKLSCEEKPFGARQAEKGPDKTPNWDLWPVSSAGAVISPGPDPPLLAAVRAHVEGKPERAIEALAMLDAENQDFVLALLPVLSSGAAIRWREDATTAAEVLDQLQALTERLERYAALRLGTVAFCHPVHGYRRYEPRPTNMPYRPGDLAQLYIEVRNIGGQPGPGPRGESWLIQVQASVVIRDAHGQAVAMPDPADRRRRVPVMRFEEKRYTRGPIRDYYLLCAFPVPEQPGVYTATVDVSDATGRRSGPSSAVEFRVAVP